MYRIHFIIFISILFWLTMCGDAWAACDPPLTECTNAISFSLISGITKNQYPLKIDDDGATIRDANFQRHEAIKFVILNQDVMKNSKHLLDELVEAYTTLGLNVITMDYSKVGAESCLIETVWPSIPTFGKCAARLLDLMLAVRHDVQLPQFHVIAYDDGVHVAAYMARELKSGILRRLTALEPIFIDLANVDQHLSRSSASFVDVYYTNSLVGSVESSDAHLEMYFNNGVFQEACLQSAKECSHKIVIMYFTESIKTVKGFYASTCAQRYWNGCTIDDTVPLKQVGEYATPVNQCVSYSKNVYTMLTDSLPPFTYGYAKPKSKSTIQEISADIFLMNAYKH